MGNCCKPASSMEWGGEDWGSLTSKNTRKSTSSSSSKVFDEAGLCLGNVQKEKLLGSMRASADANGKVKLKISKKELAELLGAMENNQQQEGRASAEQVLFRLINARDHAKDAHHGPWKPVLESIAES